MKTSLERLTTFVHRICIRVTIHLNKIRTHKLFPFLDTYITTYNNSKENAPTRKFWCSKRCQIIYAVIFHFIEMH